VAERPTEPASEQGFASHNGWDREYEVYDDFDLPTYVGPSTFMNLPWVTEPDELRRRGVDVAIVTGLLGMFWAVTYLRRRSIVAPVVSHSGFNLLQLGQFLLAGR